MIGSPWSSISKARSSGLRLRRPHERSPQPSPNHPNPHRIARLARRPDPKGPRSSHVIPRILLPGCYQTGARTRCCLRSVTSPNVWAYARRPCTGVHRGPPAACPRAARHPCGTGRSRSLHPTETQAALMGWTWWLVPLARSTDQPRRTSALIIRSATMLAIRPTLVARYLA